MTRGGSMSSVPRPANLRAGVGRGWPLVVIALAGLWLPGTFAATAPRLHRHPAYQSTVRALPDDLLLIAGDGLAATDTVVYQSASVASASRSHPMRVPQQADATQGTAKVVSAADAPYSLTVHLPAQLTAEDTYALWVVNSAGEWSDAIFINDARPLWISPNEIHAGSDIGAPGRLLKVVGRNLNPVPGVRTGIRLVGARKTYALDAEIADNTAAAIDRYAARARLPASLVPGQYHVEVSRDRQHWVPLADDASGAAQVLTVLADPHPRPRFVVGDYTREACDAPERVCRTHREACVAGSDGDHTACVVAAVAAAASNGGGVVVFRRGNWSLLGSGRWPKGARESEQGVTPDGILVPSGVDLEGESGAQLTTLTRGTGWEPDVPTFSLQGHNRVSGLTFRDERKYDAKDNGAGMISLGVRLDRVAYYRANDPRVVTHVQIDHNVFEKPFIAVTNGGLSVEHLTITENVFRAFRVGITWEGNVAQPGYRYHYSDSAVVHNRFEPGSYLDTAIGQGTIASHLSGGYRTDFSDNVADGAALTGLYDPGSDARGWRAAFFWAMHDNVEMSLVSQNLATCTGDKDGDGEAIAYDNNHNRTAFPEITASVLDAHNDGTDTIIRLRGAMRELQQSYGQPVHVGDVDNYYVGDWVQIVQGRGLGQARKIVWLRSASDPQGATVTIRVRPALEVMPGDGSLLTVNRLIWQSYTVGNTIDQRPPLCLKSNRTRRAGGLITLYGPATDSVIDGNTQYDSSGIALVHAFELIDAKVSILTPEGFSQSFNEIRGNRIVGTYDAADRSRQAGYGIALIYGATPDTASPPVLSYGLVVAHNVLEDAAGPKGAISLSQGWYTGPVSRRWPGTTPWKIADTTLVSHNEIRSAARSMRADPGIGISAADAATPVEWRTVLYANQCPGRPASDRDLVDNGTSTVIYCPTRRADDCECKSPPTDLRVTGAANPDSAANRVTWDVLISNAGPALATGIVMSVEAPDSLRLESSGSDGETCDLVERTVRLCRFRALEPGRELHIVLSASELAEALPSITVSVTHREADTDPTNDSITLPAPATASAAVDHRPDAPRP